MKKLLFLFFSGLCVFTARVWAAPSLSYNISQSYVSSYIWRGIDLYPKMDPGYQPSATVTVNSLPYDCSASFNVWASFPLHAGHQDAQEFDYTGCLTKNITDKFSLSACLGYYYYPNTTRRADEIEPSLAASYTLPLDFIVSAAVYYDFPARRGGFDDVWYWSFGVAKNVPLPAWPVFQKDQALNLSVKNYGQKSVASGAKVHLVYASDYALATTYKWGKVSFTPGLTYTVNYSEAVNSGNDILWGGITLGYDF